MITLQNRMFFCTRKYSQIKTIKFLKKTQLLVKIIPPAHIKE